MTNPASTTADALPKHPAWCRADQPEARRGDCDLSSSPNGFHEGDTLHVEARGFEISITTTLVQYDEHGVADPQHRHVAEPQVRLEIDDREGDTAGAELTLDEVDALLAMLQHQRSALRRVHAQADSDHGPMWALGWQPEPQRLRDAG